MKKVILVSLVAVLAASLGTTGCASKSASGEQAKKGAAYGALGGATAGFIRGLISGDPLGRAAEGAVVGAGTGAVVGAVHGSAKDKDMKAEVGDVNFKAIMALVHRDYPSAKEFAAKTAHDPNETYRLVSVWVSALVAKETLAKDQMNPYYEKLIEADENIDTVEDARVELRMVEKDLKKLRKEFNAR